MRIIPAVRPLATSLFLLAVAACGTDESSESVDSETTASSASSTASADSSALASSDLLPNSAVRHVVIFQYRETATEADITRVTDAFRALRETIPGILGFERGVNNSPEGLNLGFTHAYTLTFQDTEARDAYLPHPDHLAFGDLLAELDVVEEVFVVDYIPLP